MLGVDKSCGCHPQSCTEVHCEVRGSGCNPTGTYLGVSPTEHRGISFWVNLHITELKGRGTVQATRRVLGWGSREPHGPRHYRKRGGILSTPAATAAATATTRPLEPSWGPSRLHTVLFGPQTAFEGPAAKKGSADPWRRGTTTSLFNPHSKNCFCRESDY